MKIQEFLAKYNLLAGSIDEDRLTRSFISEMKKGLSGKRSSLEMIPTYQSESVDIKSGESVIVIDAGGTNFRTCLVTFDNDQKPVISDFRKSRMPGIDREVSAKEFFSIIADNIERLVEKSDRIAFCFSYSAKITREHDGIVVNFSKEIKAGEVIGMKLGENLLSELASRGYDTSRKRVVVLNDTVATLLAAVGSVKSADGYIGFILGTGTNTAYGEKNANIAEVGGEGSQIINTESGAYEIPLSPIDKAFIESTKKPEIHHFEKLISGAYLGPFAHLVISKAVEEGIFTRGFASRFRKMEALTTIEMSDYLEDPLKEGSALVDCVKGSDRDAKNLYILLRSVVERAAKFTAVNISAAVLKSERGKDPRYPVVINADGTTFYKTRYLRQYTLEYLHQYLEVRKERYFEIVNIADSPVIGSAIAGLSI